MKRLKLSFDVFTFGLILIVLSAVALFFPNAVATAFKDSIKKAATDQELKDLINEL